MLLPASQAARRLTNCQCLSNYRSPLLFSLGRVSIVYSLLHPSVRHYADTRPVSRPKAHTGRTASTRKPKAAAVPKPTTSAQKSTTTAKKPAPKKAVGRPKKQVKTKAKPKPKTKPKSKPKKPVKKVLTEKQKADVAAKKKRSDVRALKEVALTPPKPAPISPFAIFNKEQAVEDGKSPINATRMKAVAASFKDLSTERREHYNHVANQNKAANTLQYRQWIESHPVSTIHKANTARRLLRRRGVGGRWSLLQDDREVKRLRTAYVLFCRDRHASGDFTHIPLPDRAKRIAQEWKELPADQKQIYTERQKQDLARYDQEIKTVYDRDVNHGKK